MNAVGAIQSAALASNFPFNPSGIVSGPSNINFEIEGHPVGKAELPPFVDITIVSPGYFPTIRQPILRGRDFTDHDQAKAQPVTVINQSMARHRWPNQDVIGKRLTLDSGKTWTTVVGVVGDAKEYGLDRPISDELYLPVDQAGIVGNLVVRTALDPMAVSPLIRAALHRSGPATRHRRS